jgi:ankyrin repeat protein
MREKLNPHLLAEIKQTDTGRDCLRTNFSEEDEDQFDPLEFENDNDYFLHIAARRGDNRAVELLLEAGINIDKLGDMG